MAQLKQEAQEKEKALLKYAREYVQMGDECLKHNMPDAALRNYDKAVTLCPSYKEGWKKIKKLEKIMKKSWYWNSMKKTTTLPIYNRW